MNHDMPGREVPEPPSPEEPVEPTAETAVGPVVEPSPGSPAETAEMESTAEAEAGVAAEAEAEPEPVVVKETERVYAGTGFRWGLAGGIVLTVAVIILAWQNVQTVDVNYLAWTVEAPLVAVILATAVVTVIIDELIGLIWRRRKRKILAEKEELRRLRQGGPQP